MEELDPTPQAILDRPILTDFQYMMWGSFWFLSPSRPLGMSPGAIPLTEIVLYFQLTGFDIDLEDKVRLIRAMDAEFLSLMSEK